jgi:hypothetical protein
MRAEVDFEGFIFDPRIDFQSAFSKTIAYGVDVVGSKTPVRTGNLKNSLDSDDSSIFDDVFYAGFVEAGTVHFQGRFMMEDSIEEIGEEFRDNIIELLI